MDEAAADDASLYGGLHVPAPMAVMLVRSASATLVVVIRGC